MMWSKTRKSKQKEISTKKETAGVVKNETGRKKREDDSRSIRNRFSILRFPSILKSFLLAHRKSGPNEKSCCGQCFPSPSTCCMIFRTSHGRFAADTDPAFVDNLISISIRAFFVRAERVSASCEKQQIEMKAKKCRERSQWVYLSSWRVKMDSCRVAMRPWSA